MSKKYMEYEDLVYYNGKIKEYIELIKIKHSKM